MFVVDVNLHMIFCGEEFLAVVTLVWASIVVFGTLVLPQLTSIIHKGEQEGILFIAIPVSKLIFSQLNHVIILITFLSK